MAVVGTGSRLTISKQPTLEFPALDLRLLVRSRLLTASPEALTESSSPRYLSVFKNSGNLGSSRRGSNDGSLSTQLRDAMDSCRLENALSRSPILA